MNHHHITETALALAAAGIPVFPCYGGTKAPATQNGHLDASSDPARIRAAFAQPNVELIGVPTGKRSGIDALDLDPRHGSDDWPLAGRLPSGRVHRTGGGGQHHLFRAAPGLRSSASRVAPGVDVRADGGYIIWWSRDAAIGTLPDWPQWLLELALTPARDPDADISHIESPPNAAAVIDLLDRLPNPASNSRDVWTAVMLAAAGCAHSLDDDTGIAEAACRWADRWPGSPGYDAEMSKWESDWSIRDKPLAGWRNLRARAAREIPDYAVEIAAAEFTPLPAEKSEYWRDRLQRARPRKDEVQGAPKGNLYNATLALGAAEWRAVLKYDEFSGQVLLAARPPWHVGPFTPRQCGDLDCTRAAVWLQGQGIQVSSEIAREAIAEAADRDKYHPVREYFASLKWDGQARADTWLMNFSGAADNPLNRAVAAKFLISMVARVMMPGCKVDTVLILEGKQGIGKSSLVAALGGPWFIDHMPDISSKDAQIQLLGKLLVEFAELDKLSRAEVSHVKAFISQATDRFRKPFGKVAGDVPRQCVFAGTVNPTGQGYLQDETGSRRFWPVACRFADVKGLAAVRDQLFAEAVARFNAGETWWLDGGLEVAQEQATAERFAADAWTDRVLAFAADKESLSTGDILGTCLGKPAERWSHADMVRVGKIMLGAGWVVKQLRTATGRERRYVRADGDRSTVVVSIAALVAG